MWIFWTWNFYTCNQCRDGFIPKLHGQFFFFFNPRKAIDIGSGEIFLTTIYVGRFQISFLYKSVGLEIDNSFVSFQFPQIVQISTSYIIQLAPKLTFYSSNLIQRQKIKNYIVQLAKIHSTLSTSGELPIGNQDLIGIERDNSNHQPTDSTKFNPHGYPLTNLKLITYTNWDSNWLDH